MSKVLIGVLITFFILIAGFIYFSLPSSSQYSNSQKEKKASSLLGRKAILTNEKTGETEYKDDYLTFKYPSNAKIYRYKDPSFASRSGTLALFSYDISNPRLVFNYVASKRSIIASLNDDPSYLLRKNPERGYAVKIIKIGNLSTELFSKNESQQSERAIFIIKDGVEYVFTILGSDSENLDELVSDLSKSLRFIQ